VKARTSLNVKSDMEMTVILDLTVYEAQMLIKQLEDVEWPSNGLREVLQQALTKATQSYASNWVTEV